MYVFKKNDYQQFPWVRNYENIKEEEKDWEFRKVEVEGAGLGSRFFVARERFGRKGYLVFSGMITAYTKSTLMHNDEDPDPNPPRQKGIIVCLGWIPQEDRFSHLKPFGEEGTPAPEDKENSLFLYSTDPYTGSVNYTEDCEDYDLEKKYENFSLKNKVKVRGYLRKQEENDFFRGRWNNKFDAQI